MPVLVKCPNPACGKLAAVPDEQAGRGARCPHCGLPFTIAGPHDQATSRSLQPEAEGPPETRNLQEGASSETSVIAAASSSSGSTPPQVGRYLIRAKLGAGAFGVVYQAYDPQLDREVALKVPQPGAMENPKVVARFLREAKAAARLEHPNIVPVHDAGFDGIHYYIASAFVEGEALANAIGKRGLPIRRAARIVKELADALAHAHTLGIVHRDVKPANVMLDRNDTARLMDFGLAHRQDATANLTQIGSVLGTPAYMAPEQAAGSSGEALPASDQYSLGVVLYELLCGELPFTGPPAVVLFNAIHQQPAPPHRRNPLVPPELEAICLKAMAKRPENRYPTCRDMADDLQRWLRGKPVRALEHGLVQPGITLTQAASAQRSRQERRRRSLWVGLSIGGILGIVAVALTVWSLTSDSEPRGSKGSGPIAPFAQAPGAAKIAQDSRLASSPMNVRGNATKEPAKKPASSEPVQKPTETLPRKTPDDSRRFWQFAPQHGSGYFKLVDNGKWDEIGRDGKLMGTWEELDRTPEYVELYDPQRGYKTRLGEGKAWIANGRNSNNFNPSPEGNWVRLRAKATYLSDMQQVRASLASPLIEKKSNSKVKGVASPNGIFMHPPDNGVCYVTFKVEKKYRRFKASVGIQDGTNGGAGSGWPLTFVAVGDGKVLWRSAPVQRCGETQDCDILISGVDVLELRVECPGTAFCAHAVWIEPRVEE